MTTTETLAEGLRRARHAGDASRVRKLVEAVAARRAAHASRIGEEALDAMDSPAGSVRAPSAAGPSVRLAGLFLIESAYFDPANLGPLFALAERDPDEDVRVAAMAVLGLNEYPATWPEVRRRLGRIFRDENEADAVRMEAYECVVCAGDLTGREIDRLLSARTPAEADEPFLRACGV